MNTLVIYGLLACCLLCLLVIAYYTRELARARRAAQHDETPPADTSHASRTLAPTRDEEKSPAAVEAHAGDHDGHASHASTGDSSATATVAATEGQPATHTPETATHTSETAADMSEALMRALEAANRTTDEAAHVSGRETDSSADTPAQEVYIVADALNPFFSMSAHPSDFLTNKNFLKGVELLQSAKFTTDDLINYYQQDYGGTNTIIACMSLEALARRREDGDRTVRFIISYLNSTYYYTRYFALRAIHALAQSPVALDIILMATGWTDPTVLRYLRDFISWRRLEAGETITFGYRLAELETGQIPLMRALLEEIKESLPEGLQEEFMYWEKGRVDEVFLKSFGRVWERDAEAEQGVVMLEAVSESVAQLETALRKEPSRSVVLVGEHGVGKTTLLRVLAGRLQQQGWTIFEASAADVLAGQQYIGQLEGRVQQLVREIGGKRVLWVVPNFHEMLWAGRHSWNPVSVLDNLLPQIESGQVKIVGETTNVAFEKMVQMKPQVRTVCETCLVLPMPDAETLELARQWAARHSTIGPSGASTARISEETLQEAFQLAKQYLANKAAPGNLLQFLDSTHRRLQIERGANGAQISLDDLLVTLSQMTGLPVSILDDREGLDLKELQKFFEQRVLGQPEAVECLVERVAMIKAGLTDPTRPQGVFLFVGPTGTGKTEIAKTLAEFLFGSPDRMIRLDMSEFQTWDSIDRILGETNERGESEGTALVNAIRKQPFSVVLLDEFEKAHAGVWDLFLQVFDDGRLTDRRGNTADFRHCVVIMTSNLGATLPHGTSIGFSQEQAGFASASVERAVARAFRREFINRIDRVVVFRPLGRAVMRDLLRKELNDVLRRRGLRTRSWAVEWEESAIEFLLQKGFTPDLGARPLKRAVERYLLAPLARTIVNHQFPEGDQFLFVRSHDDSRLDVVFVDPDAPDQFDALERERTTGELAAPAPSAEPEELRLEAIALDPHGTPEEFEFLAERFRQLEEQAAAPEWQERKARAFAQIASPEFWQSPERFGVLGAAEYLDRIEAGLDTAGSLLNRLTGSRDRRLHFPRDLVGRLAEQLYLLDAACSGMARGEARDAFLLVSACREQTADASVSDQFAVRLARMYRQWAQKRRMSFEVLEEKGGSGDPSDPYRMILAVSGFGAYTILRAESGLHVLETPQEKSFNRARVLVRVVPQPDEPPDGHGPDALRQQAARAFSSDAQNNSAQATTVVRRYREDPSPLVRDQARGWRTGKLERVLEGDFDLMF